MRTRSALGILSAGVIVAGIGCGGAGTSRSRTPEGPAAAVAPVAAKVSPCARVSPGVGAKRLGEVRASSAVALATMNGTTYAYVADSDEPTLHTIDVDAGAEIATTDLKGPAEHVMVLADGRVAVTLRRDNLVQVLEPAAEPSKALAERCAIDVPTEPFAMASTPDDSTLLVTSGWAHTLTVLDGVSLEKKASVDLPREPRAVIVDDSGQRAFVAHLVNAQMSVVDLGDKHEARKMSLAAKRVGPALPNGAKEDVKMRSGCQGFALAKAIDNPKTDPIPVLEEKPTAVQQIAPLKPGPLPQPKPLPKPKPQVIPGRVFAPMVTVDPGDPGRIAYYGNSDGLATEVPQVPVVDSVAERVLTRSVLAPVRGFVARNPDQLRECLLPRAAAYSDGSLYVTCMGIDTLVQMDARSIDPARTETKRWKVPAGPTGLAIDAAHERAIVWSQFDRAVAVVSLDGDAQPKQLAVSRKSGFGLVGDAAVGRVLFHKTGDGRISTEGMACASCHPDGREDAITWGTQDGPRQTIMLSGRLADTAPYSWNGAHATLEEHVKDTMNRLRGTGLTNEELGAVVSYLKAMPGPNVRQEELTAARAKMVEDGHQVFLSAQSGCSSCHNPDKAFADAQKHDVEGVMHAAHREIETPSLRFLSGTAPYFHDGRYPTLEAMLEATDHSMGYSMSLTRDQRMSLAAYLETL